MIVVTGAAGFIGSCLLGYLNELAYRDLVIVDDFGREDKKPNYEGKLFKERVDRKLFHSWLREHEQMVQYVFHLGARTDTTLQDIGVFDELNLDYSKEVFAICAEFGIPLLYASSAATYGDGAHGFNDDLNNLDLLKPMNPYGQSKHDFDRWVLKQDRKPPQWVGLKFFNVFGPNEFHKGRMASVVFHAFNQIKDTGKVKLFRSHKEEYKDGAQLRDFIYVKDLLKVCLYFMMNRKNSGIYNLGTGKARSFNDLIAPIFKVLKIEEKIEYIDIPEDIRETYQYFTEANMDKVLNLGYEEGFTPLEEAVSDYVSNYLISNKYY